MNSVLRFWKQSDVLLWRALALLRDGWLVVGVAILAYAGLDMLYRGEVGVRSELRRVIPRTSGPVHPYHAVQWWRDFDTNIRESPDPYRSWWALPHSSRYIHIDSAGDRETLNPTPAGTPGPTLFMLGGSVMWGYTARDSATIPSLVAARLAAAGVGPLHVVNLAQPAYNSTQEVITLLLELRRGQVPAAAVFLDGSNDVLAAYQQERAGAVFGQSAMERRSESGWRWVLAQGLEVLDHTRLGDRMMRAGWAWRRKRATRPNPVLDCGDVAAYYRRNVLNAEALGREWNFPVVFLWQPSWATTGKHLTDWEASIKGEGQFPGMMRRCSDRVEALMQDQAGRAFVSLTSIFDRDTASVFLDEYGHVTEAGDQEIADRITTLLLPLLPKRSATSRSVLGATRPVPGTTGTGRLAGAQRITGP